MKDATKGLLVVYAFLIACALFIAYAIGSGIKHDNACRKAGGVPFNGNLCLEKAAIKVLK